MRCFFGAILLSLCINVSHSQDYELPFGHITLDSFTVTAVRQGLDIDDLVRIMQFDSSLYIAFNNLHFIAHSYSNEVTALDRRKRESCYLKETVEQSYDGSCRRQAKTIEELRGTLENKRGGNRYYTLDLFDRTFYTEKPVCGEKPKTRWRDAVYGSKEEGHLGAIKRAVFNPGTPIDVPLIGKKFALFEPSMSKYYDYAIRTVYKGGVKCYEFNITVKPEYAGDRKSCIVRTLTTTFTASEFQVISREYEMRYSGALVKLDFEMSMQLTEVAGAYYPSYIFFDGYWKVPARKLEDLELETVFDYR